jgi:hypothetical protein
MHIIVDRLNLRTTIPMATVVSTGTVSDFGHFALETTWNFDSFSDV